MSIPPVARVEIIAPLMMLSLLAKQSTCGQTNCPALEVTQGSLFGRKLRVYWVVLL
jgi:hypothetical protein